MLILFGAVSRVEMLQKRSVRDLIFGQNPAIRGFLELSVEFRRFTDSERQVSFVG